MQIKVYKEGTTVYITQLKQSGYIVGIIIRQGKPSYEVSYFAGYEYRIIVLQKYEFTTGEKETQIIGFK